MKIRKTRRVPAKSRKFRKIIGTGKNPIDHYPRIDAFIPDAEVLASRKFNKKENRDRWDIAFLDSMNELLSNAGLRVL